MRTVQLILGLMFLMVSYTSATKKLVGSKECIISQYCEQGNAIKALQETFAMSEESAIDYMANRTIISSCSCHDSCAFLDICCQDKRVIIPSDLQPIASRLMTDSSSYTCQKTLERDTVVVNTCPTDAQAAMKQKCAEVVEHELLVTSNSTSLTYKNIYCGLCNGEKYEKLMPWSWSYDCYFRQLPEGVTSLPGGSVEKQASVYGCYLNQTAPLIPPNIMEVHHKIGIYLDNASLCSSPPISSCPTETDQAHDCENKPVSLIYYNEKVYRNEHCLRCAEGSAAIATAICEACENEGCKHKELHSENAFFGSFGILVQPYDDTSVVTCKTTNDEDCGEILDQLITCGHGQYLDYPTGTCQNVCPQGFHLQDGSCVFIEEACQRHLTMEEYRDLSIGPNITKQLHGNTFLVLEETDIPCFDCSNITAITNNTKDFSVSENGSIMFKSNGISSNFVYRLDNSTFYVCLDSVIDLNVGVNGFWAEEVITYFLLSLSILGLLLYLAAYIMFKRLRNIPGKIVAGNMLCLFLAYVLFLIRSVPGLPGTTGCAAVAILINYFFLASFTFNIIYAAFIVHSLDTLEYESNTTQWTAFWMWVIGLLVPFAVIIPAIVLDQMPGNAYKPMYGGELCFINNSNGLTIFFIIPIGLCLLVAVLLYLVIVIKLVRLAKETKMVRTDHSEKISVAIKLLIVLGFNWIFAVIAAINRGGEITTFIFIVTCTLQGFFGFAVFICNKATLIDLKKCLNKQTNLNFEMGSSTRASNGKNGTISSDAPAVWKKPLHHKNSSTVLLSEDVAA